MSGALHINVYLSEQEFTCKSCSVHITILGDVFYYIMIYLQRAQLLIWEGGLGVVGGVCMSAHVHARMTARHPCCVNSIQQSMGWNIVKENYMNILIIKFLIIIFDPWIS